jgi:cobalamin synthase
MSLGNAIGYLTAARVPARRGTPLVYSLHYFPWIGAAVGSLSVLLFLLADHLLPNGLACLLAVLIPQALTGWDSWRGVAEAVQGHRNHPGHGFHRGFRLKAPGWTVVGILFALKWLMLWSLPLDWQTRAVFVFPILGMCARTASFLGEPMRRLPMTPALARSRVRGGFLSGFQLFLVFLFPVRLALPLVLIAVLAVRELLRRQNRRTHGLTLQTASCASELTEGLVLASVALAAPFLFV